MDPKCCLCHRAAPFLGDTGFGREVGLGDGMRGARFVRSHLGGVGEFGGKWVAGRLGGDTRQRAGW